MIDFTTLENAIKDVIKENGDQEITGPVLQQTLLAMLNSIKTQVNTELNKYIEKIREGDFDFAKADGIHSENSGAYSYILDEEPAAQASAYNAQAETSEKLSFIKLGMPNMIIALGPLREAYEPEEGIPFADFFNINDENSFYLDDLATRLEDYARNGTGIVIYDAADTRFVPISARIISNAGKIKNIVFMASYYCNMNPSSGTYEGGCLKLDFDFTQNVVRYSFDEI